MPAGSLSIKKRCFSFGTFERDDLSSVWPLLHQIGFTKWMISSVQVMTAEGMFQEMGMDYRLAKAQEVLARLRRD
jgi:hypothetical protein